MDTIDGDPQLASEVLGIMGRELKAAKARVKEFELAEKLMQDRLRNLEARAEAAEGRATQFEKERDEAVVRLSSAFGRGNKPKIKQEIKKEEKVERTLNPVQTPTIERDKCVSNLSVQDNHVKNVEDQLEKYYAKYKAAKSVSEDIIKSYTELQQRTAGLEEALRGARRLNESMIHKIPEVLTKSSCQLMRDILAYMASLPKIGGRPSNDNLQPICSRNVDIRALLQLANVGPEVLDNFLYLPDRLHWCPGPGFHGLGISPLQVVNTSGGWEKKKPQFRSLFGRKFHLFFSTTQDVRYAGTYKAVDLRHMGSEGHADLPTQIVGEGDAIIEASITPSKNDNNWANKKKKELVKLYQAHILKVELIGLQCVGFDANLYDTLKAKFVNTVGRNEVYYPASAKKVAQGSKKRKREE